MPVFRSGSVVPFGKASQRKSEILPDGTSEGQVLSLSKRVIPDMFSAVTILFICMDVRARFVCVRAHICLPNLLLALYLGLRFVRARVYICLPNLLLALYLGLRFVRVRA